MNSKKYATVFVLTMMLSAGCLSAIEDIAEIEDDVIDSVLDWLDSEYPHLDLPARERTSPVLETYGQCEPLLACLLYTSPSPRDLSTSRMPSSA